MSVFSIQRDLEDYLAALGLEDRDQYAVRLANFYDRRRGSSSFESFCSRMRGMRTVFYRVNSGVERREFERALLERLDSRYLKKNALELVFPGGVVAERRLLTGTNRRTIRRLLGAFRAAVEARAVDAFWHSRARGKLKNQPEKIAQGLLAMFATGVLGDGGGLVLREFGSGVGYVDVGIIFAKTLHIVEIKIFAAGAVAGVEQLATYMRTEGRQEGWLVVVDARPVNQRTGDTLSGSTLVEEGTVHLVDIDIHPIAPSRVHKGST